MHPILNELASRPFLALIVAILLPLIPALILYKLLPPGKVTITGPWQGLTVKLTGAAGLYFLLVVTFLSAGHGLLEEKQVCEVWTVKGTVKFSDDGGAFDRISAYVVPPLDTFLPTGRFEINVVSLPGPHAALKLPAVILEHEGYKPATLDLEALGPSAGLGGEIAIEQPVVFDRLPSREYQPGASLKPLAQPAAGDHP